MPLSFGYISAIFRIQPKLNEIYVVGIYYHLQLNNEDMRITNPKFRVSENGILKKRKFSIFQIIWITCVYMLSILLNKNPVDRSQITRDTNNALLHYFSYI
ncbi:Hypothetical_protein [Hexamita inflata]|uniref:Hypothetical_protein n=1 Tax=Hexamita inflata TaxID=28002 RepID=A0AA86NX03_9EUKA|nr:Hypothetical protein HINF_LOCUS15208 [Hexamita inflata]